MNQRIIKFRAWDKVDKVMYCDVQKGVRFDDGSNYDFDSFLGFQELGDYHKWELMQYVGLKDRNKVEMYEGDIIKFIPEPDSMRITDFEDPDVDHRIIGWDEEEVEFCYNWINGKKQTSGYTFCKDNLSTIVEIIGNIYSSPELLGEQK